MKALRKMALALVAGLLLAALAPALAFAADGGTPVAGSATAAADGGMGLAVSEVSGMPGDTVDVEISLSDNPGIASLKVDVAYDEDVLTLTGVKFAEGFGSYVTAPTPYANPQRLSLMSPLEDVAADGLFATLTFAIADDAGDGVTADVTVTPDLDNIFNGDFEDVSVYVTNGCVRVFQGVPGDVNGDKTVSNKDAILLFRYVAGWSNIAVVEKALDPTGDGKVSNKDAIYLFRYVAGWPNLNPSTPHYPYVPEVECDHSLETVAAKVATCTESGNVAYWHCAKCGKYFANAAATQETTLAAVTLSAGHKLAAVSALPPTCTEFGNIAYWHCSACGKYYSDEAATQETTLDAVTLSATGHSFSSEWSNDETYHWHAATCGHGDEVTGKAAHTYGVDGACMECGYKKPVVSYDITYKLTEYNANKGDDYITADKVTNSNSATYEVAKGLDLEDAKCAGYEFLGWYTKNGTQMTQIDPNTTGNLTLYARWQENEYTVTYASYLTPVEKIADATYTVSRGIADLPNPTINNYIFLGWYLEDGTEVTSIPAGTTGNLKLNAHWTSKRNLAKAKELGDPEIINDIENGAYLFLYELGTIENVPLSDAVWTIQSVVGLEQQYSQTIEVSVSETKAELIAKTTANATVNSSTWSLSNSWNDTTTVTEQWAEQHGMTVTEANEKVKTNSGTYSVTDSKGGSSTVSNTSGVTALSYDSTDYKSTEAAEFTNSHTYLEDTELNASLGVETGFINASVGTNLKNGTTDVSGDKTASGSENTYRSGTDTTTVNTVVATNASTWNSSATKSQTDSISQRTSTSKVLSSIIASTLGYGKTYAKGGENEEAQSFTSSASNTLNSSNTLTYFNSSTTIETSTYTSKGMSEGCYRLVVAGKIHVFGVVAYDVASKSYFTYTYSVLDDSSIHDFLDYSPDGDFDDYEYSVLPFEIPYSVHEYVASKTAATEGLEFTVDTGSKTARVKDYKGASKDVIVPSYISSGGDFYRVTSVAADSFAGKSIRTIVLGDFIEELPDGSFKGCKQLEQIYGRFTDIGAEAFSGCTSLEDFTVTSKMRHIGTDAFKGVPRVKVNVLDEDAALEVAKEILPEGTEDELRAEAVRLTQANIDDALVSGADHIVFNMESAINDAALTFDVPNLDYVEIQGGKRTYTDLKVKSAAAETVLANLSIDECTRIPLEIASSNLALEQVTVSASGYSLMLSADSPNVTLARGSALVSTGGKAVVCKNPVLHSEKDASSVYGTLQVKGNVYVCGSITNGAWLSVSSGEVVSISEEEFEKYIKGSFNVLFDANGSSVSETSRLAYWGSAIGELPVPTRDSFTFEGWYLPDGTTKVEADTVLPSGDDITLRAHWLSDWVVASEMPAGADTVETKWTYDLREYATGSSSSLDGWTRYDTTSVWGSWGGWSGWSWDWVGSSDSREVQTQSAVSSYNMETYVFSDSNSESWRSYAWYLPEGKTLRAHYSETMAVGVVDSSRVISDSYYNGPSNVAGHVYGTAYIISNDIPWYKMSANYGTQYRYRDRSLIYTYHFYKDTPLESDTDPAGGDNVLNVVKWVRYLEK